MNSVEHSKNDVEIKPFQDYDQALKDIWKHKLDAKVSEVLMSEQGGR